MWIRFSEKMGFFFLFFVCWIDGEIGIQMKEWDLFL